MRTAEVDLEAKDDSDKRDSDFQDQNHILYYSILRDCLVCPFVHKNSKYFYYSGQKREEFCLN